MKIENIWIWIACFWNSLLQLLEVYTMVNLHSFSFTCRPLPASSRLCLGTCVSNWRVVAWENEW